MEFSYMTRNQVPPINRQGVLAFSDPGDLEVVRECLFTPLLKLYDCAIWYIPSEAGMEPESYDADLRQQLISSVAAVVPVTMRLLARWSGLLLRLRECAAESGVPVFPILLEPAVEGVYERFFGKTQFLTVYRKSASERDYLEKLDMQMRDCMIADREREEILRAFRCKIFLSYRKADRLLAQRLIRCIHEPMDNLDVAIWYDEFLTPGEQFDREIQDWIEQCDVFVLAVTKRMLEPGNYVVTEEYPMAVRAGKNILAVKMEEVDPDLFEDRFPGLSPDRLIPPDPRIIDGLLGMWGDIDDNRWTPDHLYRIGRAYLNGLYVEPDLPRGVRSIRYAAERECLPAMEQMSTLYRIGRGVTRDPDAAYRWKEAIMDLLLRAYRQRTDPWDDRIADYLFRYMLAEFNQSLDDGLPEVQKRLERRMRALCDEVARTFSEALFTSAGDPHAFMSEGPEQNTMRTPAENRLKFAHWLKNASVAEASAGDMLHRSAGDKALLKNAIYYGERSCRYLERALEILDGTAFSAAEKPEAEALTEKIMEALIINRQHLADEAGKAGDEHKMQELILGNDRLLERLDEPCVKYRRLWFIHKAHLAQVSLQIGRVDRAEFHYIDSLAIGEDLFDEGDASIRQEQALVCDRLADMYMRMGLLEKMRKAVEMGYRYRLEILEYAPDAADAIRGISLSEERFGHMYIHLGQPRQALEWYQRCRARRVRLAREFPSENAWQELQYIEQCIAAASGAC